MRFARLGAGVAALVFALLLTLVLLGLPIGSSLELLFEGALGTKYGLATLFVKATPLLLVGLGIAVAWRAGMYNIGGEGQFVVGAIAGAAVARAAPAGEPGILNTLILMAAMLGGAAWAWLPGWLHVRRGVHVVIGTILLNFVAVQLVSFLVRGPLQERKGQLPLTDPLPSEVMLRRLDSQTDLHAGLVLALVACALTWVFLFRTTAGLRLRIVGQSARFARANKIDPDSAQIRAMAVSGALCGLAGAVEYSGVAGRIGADFAQGWGFLGIPVALLGALHPLGVLLSSLYFGALFAGSQNLARFSSGSSSLVLIIQGLAVLAFVAAQAWLRLGVRRQESA
ncbi:MAG TPA: ABC transporter permease [Fimbriimonadaceae bacterium]|nr:ABC transporter permease [Fimbriimonadaceae bacterium]